MIFSNLSFIDSFVSDLLPSCCGLLLLPWRHCSRQHRHVHVSRLDEGDGGGDAADPPHHHLPYHHESSSADHGRTDEDSKTLQLEKMSVQNILSVLPPVPG